MVSNFGGAMRQINNCTTDTHPNKLLRPKIKKKRRLIKQLKLKNNPETKNRLLELNKEIVLEIKQLKRNCMRRRIHREFTVTFQRWTGPCAIFK